MEKYKHITKVNNDEEAFFVYNRFKNMGFKTNSPVEVFINVYPNLLLVGCETNGIYHTGGIISFGKHREFKDAFPETKTKLWKILND